MKTESKLINHSPLKANKFVEKWKKGLCSGICEHMRLVSLPPQTPVKEQERDYSKGQKGTVPGDRSYAMEPGS